MIKHLGDGTFGRVLEVVDRRDNVRYAMKIIRAVPRYVDSAKIEVDIYDDVQKTAKAVLALQRDREENYDSRHGRHRGRDIPKIPESILRGAFGFPKMYDHFHFGDNYCIVFEPLGKSIWALMKMNKYQGFPMDFLQSIAKQLLQAIGFLHAIGITHTDLKPENIMLLKHSDLIKTNLHSSHEAHHQGDNYSSRRSLSISTASPRSAGKEIWLPRDDTIKVIDFGGATYDNEYHSTVINTRQYRGPEVILGTISTLSHSLMSFRLL